MSQLESNDELSQFQMTDFYQITQLRLILAREEECTSFRLQIMRVTIRITPGYAYSGYVDNIIMRRIHGVPPTASTSVLGLAIASTFIRGGGWPV